MSRTPNLKTSPNDDPHASSQIPKDPSDLFLASFPKTPLPQPMFNPLSSSSFLIPPTNLPDLALDPVKPSSKNPFLSLSHTSNVDIPSKPKSITFSDAFDLFPFDPSLPPIERILPSDETDQSIVRPIQIPNPTLPNLLPQNKLIMSSIHQAAVESSRPPSILKSDPTTSPIEQSPVGPPLPGYSTPNITSNTSGKPLERNLDRLRTNLLENQQILGKSPDCNVNRPYLPNRVSELFPVRISIPPLPPPTHPLNLQTILDIFHSSTPTPKASPFVHKRSAQAAKFNSNLIATFDYDLKKTFDAFPGTTISPGSEFRPVPILRPLLQGHPFWPKIEHDLTEGATYTFKRPHIEDFDRTAENEALIEYGNHSSAKKRPKALIKVSQKDTDHGWAFPITFDCARKLKGGWFGPLGVAQHHGITETGDIVLKDRLAHDQTFSTGIAPSLNLAVDDSNDIELVYGWCIERLMHQIVALRIELPQTRILICKFDWGAAYRRINGDGTLAANALTTDASGEFANVLSRLSFGDKTHPAMFSLFSETACDLCNDLTEFEEWDHTVCISPLQRLMGDPVRLPDEIPFAPGLPLIVDVPPKPDGSTDVYLDDMIQLFADMDDIVPRASAIVPLVLHLLVRPNQPDEEPILRTDILAEDKMKAEGSPSEIMRVLGWEFDTRRMLIRLPDEKFLNWSKNVKHLADPKTKRTSFQELESTVGKLLHASKGIPLARYFLQRIRTYVTNLIRDFNKKPDRPPPTSSDESSVDSHTPSDDDSTGSASSSNSRGRRPKPWYRYHIPQYVKEDLTVWVDLLKRANDGVSFNLLTCRIPTNILLADACPLGMGGYSIKSGTVWQLELDPEV